MGCLEMLGLYLDVVDDFVRTWSSDLPLGKPSNSLDGSWYLAPKQHAIEFLFLNVFFIWGIWYFLTKALHPESPSDRTLRNAVNLATNKVSKLDIFLITILTASIGLTFYHKWVRSTTIFMLQPCHVSMIALIIILCLSPKNYTPHIAFNVYCHIQWGTLLAIFFPDLRDYNLFFEIENFWIEHFLLLIAPMIMIYNNRLAVLPLSIHIALVSFFFKGLYHSCILAIVSLKTGRNLNYLLAPPPGPLESFGSMYRLAMYFFSFLLTLFTRFILVEFVRWVLPRRAWSERKGEEIHNFNCPSNVGQNGQVKAKSI